MGSAVLIDICDIRSKCILQYAEFLNFQNEQFNTQIFYVLKLDMFAVSLK